MPYSRRHPDPLFVFGALRSGTTLLRLMLKNHSRIHSPGEADYLFDHIVPDPSGPGGWRYDRAALEDDWIFQEAGLDLPKRLEGADLAFALADLLSDRGSGLTSLNIHRNAPAMAQLFPKAKFIHLLRDPRDVARSSVGMGWNGNSYFGVHHWIETETGWDKAGIPREQVLTVRFEDLMQDLETGLGAICVFLDLDFEPKMLDYHKTSTYGPPDPNIAQKWRKKAGRREVARIEGLAGALMDARGYDRAGEPVVPGIFEEVALWGENHFRRWRFNIHRYGFGLFAGHHLARLIGLKSVAQRMAMRKQTIKIQNLK